MRYGNWEGVVKSLKTAKKRSWLRLSEKVGYWVGKRDETQLWTILGGFKRKREKNGKRDRKRKWFKCVYRCVCMMCVRANSIVFGKSQENFVEKIFKIFVDTFWEFLYHVIVRWCERLKNRFWKNLKKFVDRLKKNCYNV